MGERIRKPVGEWNDEIIAPGESRDVKIKVSESYSGMTVHIPLHVKRSDAPGPTVFVTAALHGDEINGTGAIRSLIQDSSLQLKCGAVILIPVLNILAFERHSRYLPDRRDLNRSFPGSSQGSLASRMARTIFDEIVSRADYGIDLHTAAVRRTNYPSVRGDLRNRSVRRLAEAFHSEIIINGKGPKGALRREACIAGCPVIIMEGGEVWKVEPGIMETALRGIKNVLRSLDMIEGECEGYEQPVIVNRTKWIRAETGGFLEFHVAPGEFVERKQPLATGTNLLGHDRRSLLSPFRGIVLGMTTLPAVAPGEPVCHIGELPKGVHKGHLQKTRSAQEGLEERVVEELASNLIVVEHPSGEVQKDSDPPVSSS